MIGLPEPCKLRASLSRAEIRKQLEGFLTVIGESFFATLIHDRDRLSALVNYDNAPEVKGGRKPVNIIQCCPKCAVRRDPRDMKEVSRLSRSDQTAPVRPLSGDRPLSKYLHQIPAGAAREAA